MTTSPSGTASSSDGPDPSAPRAKHDYSANLGLIVIVIVVMGGAMLIASQVGAGAGTIIAGSRPSSSPSASGAVRYGPTCARPPGTGR